VYVADRDNNRIQKFTSDGTFILAFSGPPNPDPNHFNGPAHLALDPQANLLVSNEGGYRIEKFSPSGAYLATYGDLATLRDNPRGVAADSSGNAHSGAYTGGYTLGTGGYSWTLPPVTAQSGSHVAAGSGNFYDSSATTDFSRGALKSSTTAVQLNDGLGNRVGAATPVVPAVGDIISINGTYEAA